MGAKSGLCPVLETPPHPHPDWGALWPSPRRLLRVLITRVQVLKEMVSSMEICQALLRWQPRSCVPRLRLATTEHPPTHPAALARCLHTAQGRRSPRRAEPCHAMLAAASRLSPLLG